MATEEDIYRLIGKKDVMITDLTAVVTAQGPALRAAQDQIKELTSENAELKLKLLATEEKPEQLLNGGDIDQVSHVATVGVEPDSASGGEAGSGTPSSNS
jgi:hypothetical protein